MVKILPRSIVKKITPDFSQLLSLRDVSPTREEFGDRKADIDKIVKEQIRDVLTHDGDYRDEKARERKTTFEELRDSTKLSGAEKALDRLTEECWVMLILWSPVPAKAIAQIAYHVMNNPEK